MSDQEAWHELSNLYMSELEYAKAAFCVEEMLLFNPHSHLIHQRLADIRYTMVSLVSKWGYARSLRSLPLQFGSMNENINVNRNLFSRVALITSKWLRAITPRQ